MQKIKHIYAQSAERNKYVGQHHGEILKYVQQTFSNTTKKDKDALLMLLVCVMEGHCIEYAQEVVANFTAYAMGDNAPNQNTFFSLICELIKREVDIIPLAEEVLNTFHKDNVIRDDAQLAYIKLLQELVENSQSCTLAEEILHCWKDSEDKSVQDALIKLFDYLVQCSDITENIEALFSHFEKWDLDTESLYLMDQIRFILQDHYVYELFNMEEGAEELNTFLHKNASILFDYVRTHLISSVDEQNVIDAIKIAHSFCNNNLYCDEISTLLVDPLSNFEGEYFEQYFHLLASLTYGGHAIDLAKTTITMLADTIEQQNTSIQINYVEILINIWPNDFLTETHKALTVLANLKDIHVLNTMCELLRRLKDVISLPENIDEVLKVLNTEPSLQQQIVDIEKAVSAIPKKL